MSKTVQAAQVELSEPALAELLNAGLVALTAPELDRKLEIARSQERQRLIDHLQKVASDRSTPTDIWKFALTLAGELEKGL